MKVKQTAILAAIGTILTIFPAILNFFIPFTNTFFISSSIGIFGVILLIVFFYGFAIVHRETSRLRTAGVLGLIGYLIIIILNISGMISNSIFYIALRYPLKYMGIMDITSIFNRVNFIINLIPIMLIFLCFIVLHKSLNKKSPLKKAAFLVIIGQLMLLTDWIIGLVSNILLFKMFYQIVGTEGLSIIRNIESIIGLIPSILLSIFFLKLYMELNNKENNMQFQKWLMAYK